MTERVYIFTENGILRVVKKTTPEKRPTEKEVSKETTLKEEGVKQAPKMAPSETGRKRGVSKEAPFEQAILEALKEQASESPINGSPKEGPIKQELRKRPIEKPSIMSYRVTGIDSRTLKPKTLSYETTRKLSMMHLQARLFEEHIIHGWLSINDEIVALIDDEGDIYTSHDNWCRLI